MHPVGLAVGMILSSVYLCVGDEVYFDAQGGCWWLKVVLSCSYEGTSYSLLQIFLL